MKENLLPRGKGTPPSSKMKDQYDKKETPPKKPHNPPTPAKKNLPEQPQRETRAFLLNQGKKKSQNSVVANRWGQASLCYLVGY